MTQRTPSREIVPDSWTLYFEFLRKRFEAGEKVNFPQSQTADGLNIGLFTQRQRADYKAGKLSADRIAKLESIGFVFDIYADKWDHYYPAMQARFEAGESTNVPRGKVIDGLSIGTWCASLRAERKAGKLSAERVAKLDAIGFVWDIFADKWDGYYAALRQHVEAGGCANGPVPNKINGLNINQWLATQHKNYISGDLSAERADKLKSIGFEWTRPADQWDRHYEILQRRIRAGKKVNWSQKKPVDGVNVGAWSNAQREAYKAGSLCAERVVKLELLGFDWDKEGDKWDRHYEILLRRFAAGDDVNGPKYEIVDGLNIGAWSNAQREVYSAGNLSPDRVAKLEAVAFVWNKRADRWDHYYSILHRQFEAGEDVNKSPAKATDGSNMSVWRSNQRKAYRKGSLSVKHIAQLEAIGFRWL